MSETSPLLVTGANGHLGRRICQRIADSASGRPVRALVRSERAAGQLQALPDAARPEIRIVDYADASQLSEAATGCDAAIHLVGILKETKHNRYENAHERPCEALAQAAEAAGLRRVVSLSILGSDERSSNACLASRARADSILLAAKTPAVVIRVPMVLGEGDAASAALLRQSKGPSTKLVRGGATLEQPIAARDVVSALLAAVDRPGIEDRVLDLAGPESLSHRELVLRAANVLGTEVTIGSLPGAAAKGFAWLMEKLSSDPPLTSAMLGVLEHDDQIDPSPACEQLGITLTPLDDALREAFAETPA
ncbi:MAG: NAD(P)H-binding protein [Myxococcota bacterium]